MRVRFDTQSMKLISLFQSITGVSVKDCIVEDDKVTLIVPQGDASRAVGRNGVNVRRLELSLNRKLKIVEFNPDVVEFTRNIIYPLKAKEVVESSGALIITPPDLQTRGYLIGRNASKLRHTESLIKRHFDITELKVV
ncbi:MAG: NusA-like transcription termination signal-binding factor [Candidatus Woesearchaeota archaeon]